MFTFFLFLGIYEAQKHIMPYLNSIETTKFYEMVEKAFLLNVFIFFLVFISFSVSMYSWVDSSFFLEIVFRQSLLI